MSDEFAHFVEAQQPVYDDVVSELRAGRKRSHWMWFVFPQLLGLAPSAMSRRYALDSTDSAKRYLQHPVLGPRLRECTQLVLDAHDRSAEEIFGYPDDLKFRSSMTLFALAEPADDLFQRALDQYYGGHRDEKTLELLNAR
ncbi:MAG: DUF1810 domain-containing protein [Aureliella sp.]